MNRNIFPKGHKINLGKRNRLGKKHTAETVEKMRLNCGHPVSDEAKKKISESLKNGFKNGRTPHNYKGGRYINNSGYIVVLIDGKYILEHRHIVEKHFNRKLERWEHVHHANGIKDDNRLTNLQIVINTKHYGKLTCPKCGYGFCIK